MSRFLAAVAAGVLVVAGVACRTIHTQPAHNALGMVAALGAAVLAVTALSGLSRKRA